MIGKFVSIRSTPIIENDLYDFFNKENTPRFSYCEKIKCSNCYNCKEKLEVRAARDIGAWGLDYYCPKINEIVYKE